MPPTSSLNPLGQVFEKQFKLAWKLHREKSYAESNNLCQSLVSDPRIGDLHRAGCHLLLAHSPHEPIYHAEQAVRLYKGLYAGKTPTQGQRKSQENLIKAAEDALAARIKDKKEIDEEAGELSQEDSRADLDHQIAEASEPLAHPEAKDGDIDVEEGAVGEEEEYELELMSDSELSAPFPRIPTPPPKK